MNSFYIGIIIFALLGYMTAGAVHGATVLFLHRFKLPYLLTGRKARVLSVVLFIVILIAVWGYIETVVKNSPLAVVIGAALGYGLNSFLVKTARKGIFQTIETLSPEKKKKELRDWAIAGGLIGIVPAFFAYVLSGSPASGLVIAIVILLAFVGIFWFGGKLFY